MPANAGDKPQKQAASDLQVADVLARIQKLREN
jgi:hypothetical protein